jgi:hypothetical protein
MRKTLILPVAIALFTLTPSESRAQRVQFGPQVSWADDADVGLGARVVAGLPSSLMLPRLEVIGSFDFFFPGNDVNYYEVNGNVAYRVPGVTGIAPYVGGGLNIAHASNGASDTELGLNLLGGLRFGIGPRLNAFTEARIELNGGEQFAVTFGILF